jgi:hypothetical protein
MYSEKQTKQVLSGSMLILHGLIIAVGNRILPYLEQFVALILKAIKDETVTDKLCTRLACGLVSDLC